ncbi:hypothetical protein [cf. Phormidesmis sp. LEGE 11477]|uniref:hypothetical protein n=1 Tax=cf. Phormidesmis sp. LEGE 11477 TaxID=1828680 RepID=UPI0018818DA8|nr:hypothetical protein [cf. Phormidesmis sp. LEGE 11477]MBE9062218.1 hypothetical protein [cf. Phormidesmis sp. LEGE 11477]
MSNAILHHANFSSQLLDRQLSKAAHLYNGEKLKRPMQPDSEPHLQKERERSHPRKKATSRSGAAVPLATVQRS